jgi:hypothetical protein
VLDAVKGFQERRKRRKVRKDPAGHRTGRTFSILARENVSGKRFDELFTGLPKEF